MSIGRVPKARPLRASLWSRWPRWTAWGALMWSASYAVAGALWWRGVDWYPFKKVALSRASSSLLESAPAALVGPLFVLLGVVGVCAAAVFLYSPAGPRLHRIAVGFGAGVAVVGTSLIPDYTILAVLALWPVFAVFAITGVHGAQDGLGDILYWHRVNLILIFLGGLLWAAATLAAHRRQRGRCAHCGRVPGVTASSPEAGRRRSRQAGRRFVWLAVLATVPYDLTRIAWYFGWPLGLSEEMYVSLQDPPELLAVGLAFGIVSTGGAALTHGLVAGWGEAFPRWVPGVGGRPVPPMLAVVPAAAVTVALPPASIMFASPGLSGGFDMANWGTWLPSMFWIFWAIGLGAATWLYYQRRRGACLHCTVDTVVVSMA